MDNRLSFSTEIRITNASAYLSVEKYIEDFRDVDKFIGYCQQCNRYGKCWACPPFEFDADEYLTRYKNVLIVGTQIYTNQDDDTFNDVAAIGKGIIFDARKKLDGMLLALEEQYIGSRAFFAGTCNLCTEESCARVTNFPCCNPDKVRPSLEAFGFDLEKSARELLGIEMKWGGKERLPEYYTLVSGLFYESDEVICF